jgi:outer membrane protein assembly factor BamB
MFADILNNIIMRKSIYLALIVLFFCTVNRTQSQTVMFGTNPQHTGVYSSSFPSDLFLTKKWKFKTNGMILSSAVVLNNVIYFGSDDSCLYALDTLGTLKWKFRSNGNIRSTPAVKDTVVYFNNYGAKFYAVNIKTGQEIWSFNTDGERPRTGKGLNWCTPADMLMTDPWDFYLSSPAIVDTVVYFGSGVNMYAINLKNNEMIWKYAAPDIVHSSPAVYDSMVYFGCWNSRLYALNAVTGEMVWSYQTGIDAEYHGMEGIQSSPSVIDNVVVIGSRDAKVYALNAKTGSRIWQAGFGGTWMPSSFAYYNGTIFTGSSEGGGLKAINLSNGSIKYAASKNFYLTFSTPAIANEIAFIGCMNGSLFAVDVTTGTIKCRFDTDGRIQDPLNAVLDNGSLNPAVFNPVSGSPYEQAVEYVRRVLTAGSILSTPAVDENTVYFGSSDSCLYAIADEGSCTPKFQVSSSKIDVGITMASLIDTAFYVKNMGDCTNSIELSVTCSPASLADLFNIQPTRFDILPHDSVKVYISLNTNSLSYDKDYKATIVSKSVKNEYYYFNTEVSFHINEPTYIVQTDERTSVDVYPNPLREFTVLKYSLEQSCFVRVTIYSSAGKPEKVLVSQNQQAGEHSVIWNRNNGKGGKLNPGLYYCSIITGNTVVTKKILVID